MRVAELVCSIAAAGGDLCVVDRDGLEYVGPRALLTDELRHEIRSRKDEIIAWLRTPLDALSKEDQLALGYEPTLPRATLDAIFAAWPAREGRQA